MVRKGMEGRDGEVDWMSVGTTLSRANAMAELVSVQAAAQLAWGMWLKTVPDVPWLQTVAAGIERCPSHGVDRHRLSISVSVQSLRPEVRVITVPWQTQAHFPHPFNYPVLQHVVSVPNPWCRGHRNAFPLAIFLHSAAGEDQ